MQKARKAGRSGILFLLMLFVLTFAIGTTSVEAATVKLNKTSATVYVGKTVTLKVSGTTKTVTWSSSNKKVATVSSSGKVTAVKAGTATIKAKVGSKTYSCKVTVKNPYLSKTSATLIKGQTTTLTLNGATIKSASSSKKSVATVTSKGKITAKKSGTATITIKDTKGNKYTCKVTVKVGKLSSSSTSLIKGATKTLTLSNVDIKSVKSSKTSVATVSKTASRKLKITAKKSGTATITVTDKYGNTYTCKVTVKVGKLSASTASINVGSTKTLTISNVTVSSVSSSNTSVATVSKTSSTKVTITAKKAGTATITVKDSYNNSYTCKVTVKNVAATSVALSKSTLTLNIGGTSTLSATVSPSNATNKSVTWSSSNTSVATVSSAGKVTAVAAGTATITATAADGSGKKATCTVTVNPQLVTGITLNASTATLEIGGTRQLLATVSPGNATNKNVTWSSSNTSVATVDSTGMVTAVAAGTATITATAADSSGKSASCTVTVNATDVDTSGNTIALDVEKEFSLNSADADEDGYIYADYFYTPEETGTYIFSLSELSNTDFDGNVRLYQDGSSLATGEWEYSYDDDTGEEIFDISIIYQLTAGVEYKLRVYSYEPLTGKILLQKFAFGLSDVTGDVSLQTLTYYKNYAYIYLYGETASVPDFELVFENALTVDVQINEDYGYGDIVEWVYLTDSTGNTYYYSVRYYVNPSVFEVQSISGDGAVAITYSSYGNNYGYLEIAGTAESLAGSFTLTFGEGVTYVMGIEDEYAYMKLTYGGVATYYLDIYYYYDATLIFKILDVTGTSITNYSVSCSSTSGSLYIYGLTTSMPEFTLSVNDGVSYTVSTDHEDYDAVIYMTYGDSTYAYSVYYYYDTSDFEIQSVTGDITDSDWYRGTSVGYLYLYGLSSTMPEFEVETKDGITYTITTYDDGATLAMTASDGRTYTYYVYYSFDTSLYRINNISGSDVYTYSYNRSTSGGTIRIYGTASELSGYTVTLYNSKTAVVSQSSSSLVLEYDNVAYTYTVYYYCIPSYQISLDEEVSVEFTEDVAVVAYTFTPEESGTYTFYSYDRVSCDPCCYLYQDGTLLKENDDGDGSLNFSLTYNMTAGVEYTFVASTLDYEEGNYTAMLISAE